MQRKKKENKELKKTDKHWLSTCMHMHVSKHMLPQDYVNIKHMYTHEHKHMTMKYVKSLKLPEGFCRSLLPYQEPVVLVCSSN